ncbi:MAG: AcrR family transcriptional regulator [Motiliproteus sp.]|jgi:AcrR family transcriptional regulator
MNSDPSIAKPSITKPSYHHGDLHQSLLAAATLIIRDAGVEGLSMRKLADRVGVSRTAPYHHFRDKQALLSELALKGFRQYCRETDALFADPVLDGVQQLEHFVRLYLRFALDNPELYSLMFGQTLWKSGTPSEALRTEAYASFRDFVKRVAGWQQQGVLPDSCEPLRYAQVAWSTLHGLSRLVNDGIYVEASSVDEISSTVLLLFRQQLVIDSTA